MRGAGAHQEGSRGHMDRGYNNASPAIKHAAPAVYPPGVAYGGAPNPDARGPENGRSAVGDGAGGRRAVDPIIPLALGGAPIPPVAAAVPGKRVLVNGAPGGPGGFPGSDNPSRARYHAAAANDGYQGVGGGMARGDWSRGGGGSSQMAGGGLPFGPFPAPAMLPPPSSLRPLPLPAGRAQGARLMITGTHPAVPERRIHALASAFGIVGKIEVLEVLHVFRSCAFRHSPLCCSSLPSR